MTKLLAYGGGLTGRVVEGEPLDGKVRLLRGDWVRDRDISSSEKVTPINMDEEFTVREFITKSGEVVLVAEHEVVIPDEELQKKIDVMKSLRVLP